MGNRLKMFADVMAFHQEVSGSCILVSVRFPDREQIKFVVDFGLYQGKDRDELYFKRNSEMPFDPEDISFALVTHNHIDHTGRLPYLVRKGFNGKIYTSYATKLVMPYALHDCRRILSENYVREHKKPIYSSQDIDYTMKLVQGVEFNTKISITPNIAVTFFQNAHILGAAMILVEITYGDEEPINLFFTGDYNSHNDFFDAQDIPEEVKNMRISSIMCESTYGTTSTQDIEYGQFKEVLLEEINKGKKHIIIPALSQQRSQQILYEIKKLQDSNDLSTDIPIFFDGKLAQIFTRVYMENDGLIKESMKDFLPKNLVWVYKEYRNEILDNNERKIIVTTSGMGSHGPAKQYIPRFCSDPNSSIIFTCYLPDYTVGGKIINTKKGDTVAIYGLMKKIHSDVFQETEFSSHAKSDELIKLLQKFTNLRSVLVNHGEEDVKEKFANTVFDEVDTRSVGILNRDYLFRIGSYGVDKTISTKFTR